MSVIFNNCIIDVKNGIVTSKKGSKRSKNISGYYNCKLCDKYGNKYYYIHEVIIAEGLQLPKHLWPVDEKGKRYVVDHITPVSNGGTDKFENLRLIPEPDNHRNEKTIENNSNSKKGKHYSPDTEFKKEQTPWNKGKTYHTGKHRKHSEETKKLISEKAKGRKTSEETKKKISDSHSKKAIYQYSKEGKLIGVYKSSKEASEACFGRRNLICMCCNGKLKTHNGYRWSYEPL